MFNPLMPLFAGRRILSHALSPQFALETEQAAVARLNELLAQLHPGTVVDTLHLSGRQKSVMLDNIGLPHKAVYEREAQKARESGEDKRKEADAVWERLNAMTDTHQAVLALRATVATLERQLQSAKSNEADSAEITRLETEANAARRKLEETEMPLKVLEAEFDSLMDEANGPLRALKKMFIQEPEAKLAAYVQAHAQRQELLEAARLNEKIQRAEQLAPPRTSASTGGIRRLLNLTGSRPGH